ncbi:MAG: aspartate kinase [Adhaeribacter sp.]
MKVFKFGGASVKDAAAVRNVGSIVAQYPDPLLVVVSAMGKTTNALEEVFHLASQRLSFLPALQACQHYHQQIAEDLFPDPHHPVFSTLQGYFKALETFLLQLEPDNYDEQYDQVVSIGEMVSSVIVQNYLAGQPRPTIWLDCRDCIQTDASWREARVDWVLTEKLIQEQVAPLLAHNLVVTQGFLGGTTLRRTTTLGREGSDFSGGIFAYCLQAESLTIWKDVDGFLNADPKFFRNTLKYNRISFHDTVEMAYYGASVIHPKTIKPLATRHIPLYVKSFLHPQAEGTLITDAPDGPLTPAFIRKADQCLISFGVRDYSFISEKNLSAIFHALAELRFKINLMQNSAISFSVCTNYNAERLEQLVSQLQEHFTIHYNTGLLLFTIKNYDDASIRTLTRDKEILLEQRTRTTFQFVCREG